MGQTTATITRRIFFKLNNGDDASAIFMSSRGDLYQEYDDLHAGPYYPDFSKPGNNVTCKLMVMSARTTGEITPTEITYSVNETPLKFDSAGNCETTGLSNRFKKNGDGSLEIIGNIADIAGGASFLIQVQAVLPNGLGKVNAFMAVSVRKHIGSGAGRVTIAPGDANNFTISSRDPGEGNNGGYSCKLKAIFDNWNPTGSSSSEKYKWEKLNSDGSWKEITSTTVANKGEWKTSDGKVLTVNEPDVDTMAMYRVTVTVDGNELMDTERVMDATDPLGITTAIKYSADGDPSSETDTNSETLDGNMSPAAYLAWYPTLIDRGTGKEVTQTPTWTSAVLTDAAGLNIGTILFDGGKYKLLVKILKDIGVNGEYDLTFSGSIN